LKTIASHPKPYRLAGVRGDNSRSMAETARSAFGRHAARALHESYKFRAFLLTPKFNGLHCAKDMHESGGRN
jgi:hypothetical protein